MGMMRYEYEQWIELYYKHYCKSLIPYLGNLESCNNGIEENGIWLSFPLYHKDLGVASKPPGKHVMRFSTSRNMIQSNDG